WGNSPAIASEHAISVLVVTCPCALALAGALSISAAVSSALRQGVLVADPRRLLRIRQVTDVILDKTGTLTQAQFQVARTELLDQAADQCHLTAIAAALYAGSPTPLSAAVRQLGDALSMRFTGLRQERTGVSGHYDVDLWVI